MFTICMLKKRIGYLRYAAEVSQNEKYITILEKDFMFRNLFSLK